jgi:MFS family permease
MREKVLKANIWKYYILRCLAKRMVWPILTLYLLRNQINPYEIGVIFAVGTIANLVFEVPAGAIADKIGRKTSMLIASVGWIITMLIFWHYQSFYGFLIANAIYWGTGSLWSGTNTAFIYETLHELGRESEIKKVTGKALFISQVVTGVLFVIVPIIAKFNLSLPFLINAFVFFVGSMIILSLAEPQRATSVKEKGIGRDILGFKTFLSNPVLLSIGISFSIITGINGILEDFRQAYLDFIHLDIVYFGFIYMGLRIIVGTIGLNTEKIEKLIGRKATVLLIPLSTFVAYTGLWLINSLYGIIFVVLDGIQDGISRPIEQEYLNRSVDGSKRATMLSIYELLNNLVRAGTVFLGGYVIERFGIQGGFLLSALLVLFLGGPLILWFFKRTEYLANNQSVKT